VEDHYTFSHVNPCLVVSSDFDGTLKKQKRISKIFLFTDIKRVPEGTLVL
jgi:hypothetical protein